MNIHTLLMALSKRSVVVFVAALVFGAAFPVAATQVFSTLPGSVLRTQDGTTIQLHRAYSLRDRYDYNRAVQKYEILLQQGAKGIIRPDINNRASIDVYLGNDVEDRIVEPVRSDPLSTTDYVKIEADESSTEELSQKERAELSRAAKIGRCYNFPGFSSSFMTLCRKMIQGKAVLNTTGLTSDIQYYKVKQRTILRGSSSSKSSVKNYRTMPYVSGRRASSSSSSSTSRKSVGY